MEVISDAHIHNKACFAQVTKSGMFLQSKVGCCGGVTKAFIPWASMTSMTYQKQTCCKKSRFLISDRLLQPIDVGSVSFDDFEAVRNIFSQATAEEVGHKMKLAGEAFQEDAELLKNEDKGLNPKKDGIHRVMRNCGCAVTLSFIPWAKIDGLMLEQSSCFGGALYLITEAGQFYKVVKSNQQKNLWKTYDELKLMKYGSDPGAMGSPTVFNEHKDERYSCVLTDQSVRLSLKNNAVVEEIDLDRVLGARCGKTGKRLEIAISMGARDACTILSVDLAPCEDAYPLIADLKLRARRRKEVIRSLRSGGNQIVKN